MKCPTGYTGLSTCVKHPYAHAPIDGEVGDAMCERCLHKMTMPEYMSRSFFLARLNEVKESIGLNRTMREFVCGLHEYHSIYHFDDNPADIISGKSGESLFLPEEVELVRSIVAFCYCEEMFDLAIELTRDGEE